MLKINKAMFSCTASVMALAMASPGFAQEASANGQSSSAAPADESDDIVVTGIRASIEASLQAKRNNDTISEVITAQDIGKFPDKNVADSLGRLTGVNVVTGSANAGGFGENQSVSIRGTDPTLNLTLLDGHSVATGDWFVLDQTSGGRSFDFSLLPSEIVGKLEVFKSSEADLPEGGIGGTINLHSRKPLELKANTFSLTAQANYNDLADSWKPQVSGLFSWKNQAGTFGVLASGFYQEREFRRDGQEFLGYTTYTNFANTGQTVTAPNLIGSAYFTQKRVRKGGTVALQYAPDDRFEVSLNAIYTRMDADNVNRNSMAWISRMIGNNSTPGTPGYALANYTVAGGYLTQASWNATSTNGAAVQGRVQDDIFREAYSSTWVVNLETKWKPTDYLTLSGEVGYTKGTGATTDTYAWETYWDTGVNYAIAGKGAKVNYPGLPTDPKSAAYLNNYYSWSWGGRIISPDEETYVRADATYDFDSDFLKSISVGGRYTDHSRALNYTAYSWAGNGIYSGTKGVGLGTVFNGELTPDDYAAGLGGLPQYSVADQGKVLTALATNGGRQFAIYPQASFSVKEKTEAVYAMAKLGNDSDWRGNIGVRAVHTDLATTQYTPNPLAVGGREKVFSPFCPLQADNTNWCDTNRVDRGYWDFLPSANLTFNAQPNLLLRAGVARVMTRPGYAQLAGAFTLSDLALTGNAGGNPNLNPTRAWTFNVAAEWYYSKQALFSVNLFYLDISSYITSATSTRFLTTQQHPAGANFLITGPVNGAGGTNKGVEVNWQQPIYGGFGVLANYTYADAKAANGDVIDGNSKHTFNVTAYFENSLLSTRFAYTFRSKFRSGIDRSTPMWQDDFGSLDGSLTVNVTKYLALTADAQNLLNKKLYYFVGDPAIPRAYYDNGRTFWVGAKVHF
ncbi:MAG: TonB-dependent receptor [Sphingomonas bacterium]|uniref:TonB-dependent receptor n=1 Tax=Sphingomonas bacterium TaxID=1895847 RepID=UPI0026184238|nr:TonB-dependent receptor [Sphingomonas bacterium]MDB5705800.1 TonB-dependent receptor [Sphingomonas bacterium]